MCQAPFTNPSSLSEKSITDFESNNNNGQIINAPPVSNRHQEAPAKSQASEKKYSEAEFNQSEMGVKPSSEKNNGDRVTELYPSSFNDKSVEQGCERPMSIGRLSTGKSTSESRETSQSKESSSSSRYVWVLLKNVLNLGLPVDVGFFFEFLIDSSSLDLKIVQQKG